MLKALTRCLAALMCSTASVQAKPVAFLIHNDPGGVLMEYYAQRDIMYGTKVIIDGLCMSACTLFLREDFGLDLCITDRAWFGFHMPYALNADKKPIVNSKYGQKAEFVWLNEFFRPLPIGMRILLVGKYVPSVAAGDDLGQFLMIPAELIAGVYPRCETGWQEHYSLHPKPIVGIKPR